MNHEEREQQGAGKKSIRRLESKGTKVKRQNSNQNSQTLKSQIKVIVAEILRKATKAKAKKKA